MSKFFTAGSSESESESEPEEEISRPRQAAPVRYFSDDEDDTKRIVRSQKDKRFEELQTGIKQMRNSMKIKDIAKVLTEWENLCKVFAKAKGVVDKEGIPGFYVKALADLEDFVLMQWEDREGRQKMSKAHSKALATLRQKLRKYNRDFEDNINDYKENPEKYEEEPDEDDEIGSEDEESEDESEEDVPASDTMASKFAKDDDESDSDDFSSDDDESSSDDDFPPGGMREMTAAMFLKTDKDKGEKKQSKRQVKPKKSHLERKLMADLDDEGWTEVKTMAADRVRQLFPKDVEINHQTVLKKLKEILAARGKKSTDRAEQIIYFQELQKISDKHGLGAAMSLKILFNIISACYDSAMGVDLSLKPEIWNTSLNCIEELFERIEKNPNITIGENITEDSENVEKLEEPLRVNGCPLTTVERMNSEFTKILQNCDCHSTEYVDRLKDEARVTKIIQSLVEYLEKYGTSEQICRAYLLRIEHLYYKLDIKGLRKIREQMERQDKETEEEDSEQKKEKTDTIKEETESDLKADAEAKIPAEEVEKDEASEVKNEAAKAEEETPPSDEQQESEKGTTTTEPVHDDDDAVLLDRLCKVIYAKGPDRIRTRAMLCHVYHHALHDRWYEARDMMLISHLQETIQHADILTQILYNRTMVQLGMCAFRHGLIRDAFNALHDLQTTGRAKELLAQGLMNLKNTERTPDQEKIEKRRLMPFHMHINLELLECVYLTSVMLIEIPFMAAHEFDYRRKSISKSFQHQLRNSERQPLVGPPETMREHIVAAAKAMKTGNWKKCSEYILAIKCWNLFNKSDEIKQMLKRKIQKESLRTYLFSYNKCYDTLSMVTLARMFELDVPAVHSTISKMIISEELQASLDEPAQTLVLYHGAEPTRLQSLALQLAEKLGSLVEQHEKILDFKHGGLFSKDRRQMGMGDRGRNNPSGRNQNMDRMRGPDRNRMDRGRYRQVRT